MSNIDRIQKSLEAKFARHRIVFWYDDDLTDDWQAVYDTLQLSGVTKLEVKNNEFGTKHRITQEQPGGKFLLYFRGQTCPLPENNWLLDQLLANGGEPFRADKDTLAQMDAGLSSDYRFVVEGHSQFFRSEERINRFRALHKNGDDERVIRLKMIAVVYRIEEASPEALLLAQLGELAEKEDTRWKELEKYKLGEYFWKEIKSFIGYDSQTPSIRSLNIAIFRSAMTLGDVGTQLDQRQVAVFMNRWKDSQNYRSHYVALAEEVAEMLNIKKTLSDLEDISPLMANDTFREIDHLIIARLRDKFIEGRMPSADVLAKAESRSGLFWAKEEASTGCCYGALRAAAALVEEISRTEIAIESAETGVDKYAATWWRIDQLYRQFSHHMQAADCSRLAPLAEWIEGKYLNEYLSPLAVRWQVRVDKMEQWQAGSIVPQREFHKRFVQPLTANDRKVLVVISDALRYEAGQELVQRIQTTKKLTAEIKAMLGVVPSFTQLGMAALLPHTALTFVSETGNVLVDGQQLSSGTENRQLILSKAHNGRAGAMQAKDFLALSSSGDGRQVIKDHEVVYVYHNCIDSTGDKRDTEHKTCEAVDNAFAELLAILNKAGAIGYSTMFVTADHGFLYQDKALDDADFLVPKEPLPSESINRRYIVGNVADGQESLRSFTYAQLGLEGTGSFTFPTGIQRMRKQGASSRYVHGGTSLQEIVIPLITVKKHRTNEAKPVRVEIMRGSSQITSTQVTVTFMQTEAVGEGFLPHTLRIGFYSKDRMTLLSEVKTIRFDATGADARQREQAERFQFSKDSEKFNNQDIILKMETVIPNTDQLAPYEEHAYRLRRAFESDFF